jgi:hypothetical protein
MYMTNLARLNDGFRDLLLEFRDLPAERQELIIQLLDGIAEAVMRENDSSLKSREN